MKAKVILTVLSTQIILLSNAQEIVPDLGNIGVRFATGISILVDDAIKDKFEYKPCYSLSVYPILKLKKRADVLVVFSFENKGAYNNGSQKKMEMNYATLLLAPSFHYPTISSRLIVGIYSGLLFKNEFESGEIIYHPFFPNPVSYPYIFKNWDLGGVIGYEEIILTGKMITIGIDIRAQYGFINTYDEKRESIQINQVRDFNRTRNLSFTIGLNLRIK